MQCGGTRGAPILEIIEVDLVHAFLDSLCHLVDRVERQCKLRDKARIWVTLLTSCRTGWAANRKTAGETLGC
jgi:hypothetical protein